jgi:RNA-directed DNA polymerase
MTTKRPPTQLTLDLPMPGRGEASRQLAREVEVVTATTEPESPASTKHLMEAICDPDNIEAALRTVVRNKGAPGVDGMTVRQLPGILKARWPGRRSNINCCRGATNRSRCVGCKSRSRPAAHATSAFQLRSTV